MESKFKVVWPRGDGRDLSNSVVVAEAVTLEEAAAKRQVDGDLVTDFSGKLVTDLSWLSDWERRNVGCFAHSRIVEEMAMDSVG